MAGDSHIQEVVNPQLLEILALTSHKEPRERSKAANRLGRRGGRDTFWPLVRLAFDSNPYVRQDAILGLGNSRDSRAYFFLANYFQRAEELDAAQPMEVRRRILNAFQASRDPRGYDLVQQASTDPMLSGMARHTLHCINKGYKGPFHYTFELAEEDRVNAEHLSGTPLTCTGDLEALIPLLEEQRQWNEKHFEKPQTYVVDLQRRFLVGGNLQEHVQVAGGKDVIAAGEAYFDKDEQGWHIRELNNRSTGYYPHERCYVHVQNALAQTGIRFPGNFERAYPADGWIHPDLLSVQWTTISRQLE